MNFMSRNHYHKYMNLLWQLDLKFSDFGVVAALSGKLSFRRATFVGTHTT